MNPYLRAYAAYHRDGEPFISWTDALDFHLQFGHVISNDSVFLMARRVGDFLPDSEHPTLTLPPATGTTWHIWSAAGDLRSILRLGLLHGAEEITFQRRNNRLHRTNLSRFFVRESARADERERERMRRNDIFRKMIPETGPGILG